MVGEVTLMTITLPLQPEEEARLAAGHRRGVVHTDAFLREAMVFSDPNPYVLCPLCVHVNYLKLNGGNGLVLIRRWTDTVRCCNCGHVWTYLKDGVLPVNRYRYDGLGYYIYLLVNIKTGLIYVGRTTRSLHERMWDYWSYCQNWKYWQTQ